MTAAEARAILESYRRASKLSGSYARTLALSKVAAHIPALVAIVLEAKAVPQGKLWGGDDA